MSQVFPLQCFPEPLRSLIQEGAHALDCDPRYLAMPSIACVAGAIGNSRVLRIKRTWREPAVVWAASIGESGTLKTPAIELVLKPLHRRQRRLQKEYDTAWAEYESELKQWKAKPRKDRGDEPEQPPPCVHLFCSDITTEGLADRLADNPNGMLVAVDELAGLFARFDRYASGGGDVQHYLSMFGAGALKVDRKGGDRKTIYVPYAAVSICGGIQPNILRKVLTSEFFDCGLAARLLLAMPDPKPAKWTDAEISDQTLNAVDQMYDNLYAFRGEPDTDGHISPSDVSLSPEAQERFIKFVNDHAVKAVELQGADAAAWSKLKGYAARFALIFHLVRQAGGEDVDPWQADIQSIEAGIELADFFWNECQRIYNRFRESEEATSRRELRQWLAARGGQATVRDLQRGPRHFRDDPAKAELALNELADGGYGSWEKVGGGSRGRPTSVFYLADSPDFPIVRRGDGDTNTKTQ